MFGYDTKSSSNKSKVKQVRLNKLKRFCTAKETINKMTTQSMEWEKIIANYISDIQYIYKDFLKLNDKPLNNLI